MKRRWKRKNRFLLVCGILMMVCAGCTNENSADKTETSPLASEAAAEVIAETKDEEKTENKKELEKQAIETAILRKAAGKNFVSSEEQAFLDDLERYSEAQGETEAEVQMMSEYASHIAVDAEVLDGETAKIQMKVPYLAEILEDAIASMSEDEKRSENATELVKEKVTEILASGEFEWMEAEVAVSYTMNELGVPEFGESKEYLDTLYGGLLSRTERIMNRGNANTTETEVAK